MLRARARGRHRRRARRRQLRCFPSAHRFFGMRSIVTLGPTADDPVHSSAIRSRLQVGGGGRAGERIEGGRAEEAGERVGARRGRAARCDYAGAPGFASLGPREFESALRPFGSCSADRRTISQPRPSSAPPRTRARAARAHAAVPGGGRRLPALAGVPPAPGGVDAAFRPAGLRVGGGEAESSSGAAGGREGRGARGGVRGDGLDDIRWGGASVVAGEPAAFGFVSAEAVRKTVGPAAVLRNRESRVSE